MDQKIKNQNHVVNASFTVPAATPSKLSSTTTELPSANPRGRERTTTMPQEAIAAPPKTSRRLLNHEQEKEPATQRHYSVRTKTRKNKRERSQTSAAEEDRSPARRKHKCGRNGPSRSTPDFPELSQTEPKAEKREERLTPGPLSIDSAPNSRTPFSVHQPLQAHRRSCVSHHIR